MKPNALTRGCRVRDGTQRGFEPGVVPGDGEHVHPRVPQRGRRLRDRAQAPAAGHQQHARGPARDPESVPRAGPGRRRVEGGLHRVRHDPDSRVRLEPADGPLGYLRRHQVHVHVRMHPQPVRGNVPAEHHVNHGRIPFRDGADGRGPRSEHGDREAGRVMVQVLGQPGNQLTAGPRIGQQREPGPRPQRSEMEGVVQAGHGEHRAEHPLPRAAGPRAEQPHRVHGLRRPAPGRQGIGAGLRGRHVSQAQRARHQQGPAARPIRRFHRDAPSGR